MAEQNLSVGRYALVVGWSGRLWPDLIRIDAVTEKMVREAHGDQFRQKPKGDVMITVATEADAKTLLDKISGIRGEQDRRISAAKQAANKSLDALFALTESSK